MFEFLYESLIGRNNDPIYHEAIFTPVGTVTFFAMLVLGGIFYFALGSTRPMFHRPVHWFITLAVAAVFGFIYAYWYADHQGASTEESYINGFAAINALMAALLFFLFSMAMKRFSVHARRTPF